ncbi:hypothetical protein PAXRUDRAFT_821978 [Paxillus rubicundulus Ve08.2h10]|uniref:Uncharacterized protein n=1 Tax=Paxillus rubicundulus Ve08.2h10 TaxID=930991 RepID=A0A0D0DXA9_9AGAM|nr:hypothetical protein PAXRUDRAFT_821978 [Paxillus rubicundulus Ve08.2h10]
MGSASKMPSPPQLAAKSETIFYYELFEPFFSMPNVVAVLRFHETPASTCSEKVPTATSCVLLTENQL